MYKCLPGETNAYFPPSFPGSVTVHSSSLGHKEAGAGSEIEKPTAAAMRKEASPARAARHAKQNRATSYRACRRRGSRGSEPEADDANVELRLPLSRQSAREPGLGP